LGRDGGQGGEVAGRGGRSGGRQGGGKGGRGGRQGGEVGGKEGVRMRRDGGERVWKGKGRETGRVVMVIVHCWDY
jgi:hypothetical protein